MIEQLRKLTSQIVSAYISVRSVAASDLPGLIQAVYQSLGAPGQAAPVARPVRPAPAVDIRRSVFADHLVCLEDGQKLTTLKRHLRAAHGMTPADYRAKWNLPDHYPMTSPEFAERRSTMSKRLRRGKKQ